MFLIHTAFFNSPVAVTGTLSYYCAASLVAFAKLYLYK